MLRRGLVVWVLALAGAFAFAGCGGASPTEPKKHQPPASTGGETVEGAGALLGANEVIARARRDGKVADESSTETPHTRLLEDVHVFRDQVAGMTVEAAAKGWFSLYDRYRELGPPAGHGMSPERLEMKLLLSALPGPESWPLIRREAEKRAKEMGDDSGKQALTLLTAAAFQYLDGDDAAVISSLEKVPSEHGGYGSRHRDAIRHQLVMSMASTPELMVKRIEDLLERAEASKGAPPRVELPDIVSLLGKERSRPLLARFVRLAGPRTIRGRKTRELAKVVVLEHMKALKAPLWTLVEGREDLPLYEAMLKRFPPAEDGSKPMGSGANFEFRLAQATHLLATVVDGTEADAERLAAEHEAARSDHLVMAASRFDSRRDGPKLLPFFERLVKRNGDSRSVHLYISFALSGGAADQAADKLAEWRAEAQQPERKRSLAMGRLALLWASGELDEAHAMAMELGAAEPKGDGERAVVEQTRMALGKQLVLVGDVLERPAWVQDGLALVSSALDGLRALEPARWSGSTELCELHVSLERWVDAERCLADDLALGLRMHQEQLSEGNAQGIPDQSSRLRLLARVYHDTGRHTDALVLVEEAPWWAARDIADLYDDAITVSVARALSGRGDRVQAIDMLRGLLLRSPDSDDAYEALVDLAGEQALPWLDAIYARDRFEERPLIWKAHLLLRLGRADEAFKVARQALKVDPTDGEAPSGDRLRSLAVLGDIVRAQGDEETAEVYANIVEAVRIAERGDRLKEAGLTSHAIESYREGRSLAQDAYCIHWRLAERLHEIGLDDQARKHYELAFRNMPHQFGRMAHFCFGCQHVFETKRSQAIAEQVLADAVRDEPYNPQAHFLLAKLREAQGREREAFDSYRKAVALDPEYADAMTGMLAKRDVVIAPVEEWDDIVFELMRLAPMHAKGYIDRVRNMRRLWEELSKLEGEFEDPPQELYPLAATVQAAEATGNPIYRYQGQWVGMPTPAEAVTGQQVIAALAGMIDQRITSARFRSRW